MRKRIVLLTIALIIGLIPAVFAGHAGVEISLSGKYGQSWDWQGFFLRYELWDVLTDAGYTGLANDIYFDVKGGGSPSSSYYAYKNSIWSYNGYYSKLVKEVAGYAPNNRFGWYEKGHANDVINGTGSSWAEIFSGSDESGATANFFNSNEIGFWLNPNGEQGHYFFTDTSSNSGDLQAVTFYLGEYSGFGNEYLVCFEDLAYSGDTDNDYQDMIVLLKPVPEPASMLLFGFGVLGFGFVRKRKKFKY